jgi:hypothetical protein
MLWDRAEADGYAQHMTTNPLPNTPAHQVLMIEAFGDHQVANVATEVEARTAGARVWTPAIAAGRSTDVTPMWGITPLTASQLPYTGSVLVLWDYGTPAPPTQNLPPSGPQYGIDPHGLGAREPRVGGQQRHRLVADRLRQRHVRRVVGGEVLPQLPDARRQQVVGVTLHGQVQQVGERLLRASGACGTRGDHASQRGEHLHVDEVRCVDIEPVLGDVDGDALAGGPAEQQLG